jgi:hypothetical protein
VQRWNTSIISVPLLPMLILGEYRRCYLYFIAPLIIILFFVSIRHGGLSAVMKLVKLFAESVNIDLDLG